MSATFERFLRFCTFDGPSPRIPNFTMKWQSGTWKLNVELIDVLTGPAACTDPPYKFVEKTQTRIHRIANLLEAIEVAHPADARLVLAECLDKLLWYPPAVTQPSILEDKRWRAGNAIRDAGRWKLLDAEVLWNKLGTAAEEEVRMTLLYRIFNSLSPDSKAKIVAAFMSLI